MLKRKLYDLLTKQETYLIRKGSDIRNVTIECLEIGELIALYPYLAIQADITDTTNPGYIQILNRVIVELNRRNSVIAGKQTIQYGGRFIFYGGQ